MGVIQILSPVSLLPLKFAHNGMILELSFREGKVMLIMNIFHGGRFIRIFCFIGWHIIFLPLRKFIITMEIINKK